MTTPNPTATRVVAIRKPAFIVRLPPTKPSGLIHIQTHDYLACRHQSFPQNRSNRRSMLSARWGSLLGIVRPTFCRAPFAGDILAEHPLRETLPRHQS